MCPSILRHTFLGVALLLTAWSTHAGVHEADSAAALPLDTAKTWTFGGVGSITGAQLFLSNWAAGGASSLSSTGFVNVFANYKDQFTHWDNSIEVAYGFINQQDLGFIKSDDKIEVNSQYGQRAFEKFNYSALVNFRTQFDEGFAKPGDTVKISDFLAPAYLITSLGLDYKPSADFNVLISPFTGKTTLVNDQRLADEGRFGVEKATLDKNGEVAQSGNRVWYQLGGFVKTMYRRELMENVNMQVKLDLFTNYVQKIQNIDVTSEVLIAMKVNKYVTTNLSANLIYDDDVDVPIDTDNDGVADREGPRTQLKEALGVGLSYKF